MILRMVVKMNIEIKEVLDIVYEYMNKLNEGILIVVQYF